MGFERISNISGSLCKETQRENAALVRTTYCTSRDPKDKYFIFVEAYARPFYYGMRNVYRDARNEGKLSRRSTYIRLVYIWDYFPIKSCAYPRK